MPAFRDGCGPVFGAKRPGPLAFHGMELHHLVPDEAGCLFSESCSEYDMSVVFGAVIFVEAGTEDGENQANHPDGGVTYRDGYLTVSGVRRLLVLGRASPARRTRDAHRRAVSGWRKAARRS